MLFSILLFFLNSCINTKQAIYFNNLSDTTLESNTLLPEPIIQKNDLLSISVTSLNPDASLVFNAPNVDGNNNTSASGYLVNSEGKIQFAILGALKAEGLTKASLIESIRKSLETKKLLVDPIVNIRFLNFRVTVLGEVKNPTVINTPSEKISLLEALGLAGDLTIYAKRNNVMIIREEGSKKKIKRLDLNSRELFASPYYYLKSNDIVYVEPNKSRITSTSRTQLWLPAVLSALSFAVIIIDRLIK
jgi:polysaccharide export outer membrane protein